MDINQPQNSTNQPVGQSSQQFWQPSPTASTNLDPLTQPSAAPTAPATTVVTPAPPADITAPPAPAVTLDPTPTTPPETTPTLPTVPTPPAQDTFAPTPPTPATTPTPLEPTPAESPAETPPASDAPSANDDLSTLSQPATPPSLTPAPVAAEPPTSDDSSAPAPVKNALLDHYPTGSEIIEKDILELLGSSDMSEEEKNDLYQKMNDTVANRVTARIVDALSDEEVDKWVKLLDANDQKGANELLAKKGLDPAQLIAKEALIYKTQLVDVIYGSGNQTK